MAEKHQRNRRLLVKTNPSQRSRQNGKIGLGKTTNCCDGKSLWKTDECSEAPCYRGEIRTMERILGILSTNSCWPVTRQNYRYGEPGIAVLSGYLLRGIRDCYTRKVHWTDWLTVWGSVDRNVSYCVSHVHPADYLPEYCVLFVQGNAIVLQIDVELRTSFSCKRGMSYAEITRIVM